MLFPSRILLALLLVGLAIAPVRAGDSIPQVMPPSKWIAPRTFDKSPKLDGVDPSTESRWLLVDRQINAQNDETFLHLAQQVLTPTGVMHNSHIAVEYDPSYQTPTFHWVRIWRGANSLNRLDASKILTSQLGFDLDSLLFSSQKTATLLLNDVRVGDIIDYAYTIKGSNPAFEGKFAGAVDLQYSEPVELLYTRLFWPRPRLLYIKNHNTDVQPGAFYKTNAVEFIWNLQNVPALRSEPATPSSYDPYPWVQLSEFRQWSDVNKWALRLFSSTNALDPDLAKMIRQWQALPQPENRVLAALRFVQDEIRYLALEDGVSGYDPANPSTVFARRFGDCKDKTLLLVTILRALKIEAYPVLVNTRRCQALADLRPSPTLFDHAITAVTLDGQTYWLDATAMHERGPLALRSWPDYGVGLLLRPGATALTPIPSCPVLPLTTVTEHFQVGELETESSLRITTEADGSDADDLRARFATTPREDIEQERLNTQAKLYPDIRATDPLIFVDDEQQNHVEIVESYAIRKIWSRLPDESAYRCSFYSLNVNDVMRKPSVSFRVMPLAVPFPVHRIFRLEAALPAASPITPGNQTIENPAFFFRRTVSIESGQLIVEHEYRSSASEVAADALPDYLRQLDAATDLLDYSVISF